MVRLKKARGILYVFIAMFVLGVALVPICYGQGETKEAEQPAAAPAAAPAEEPAAEAPCGPTVNINTTLFSKYVWRGYELSKDSFVIFPQVTVSYKGLSIRWWGDIDTNYGGDVSGIEPDGLQCWEQDYIAYYSNSYKKLNYTLGYIFYHTHAHVNADNQEVWVALGLSNWFNPTFSAWRDVKRTGDSWYFNFAVSHSFPIPKDCFSLCYDWSFDVGGWVSYYDQDHYWQPRTHPKSDYSGFHDGQVWAGLKIPLSDVCSITPKLQYSFPLSTKARNNIKGVSGDAVRGQHGDANFLYGGLILDYNF